MPRSHPPTLITIAERAIEDEIRLERSDHVLVAVSGGADSMALLSVLARVAKKRGFTVSAHGVDHGLRAEASAELDLAEEFARHLGVSFSRTVLRVAPGGNLQARARAARHAALDAELVRAGATCVATAHHADDRAETVLLRLLRGTSARGLAVLPARAGNRVRPLIRARKSDVLLHVARHDVPFVEDPSNRNPRFLRTRVREQLVPLLESLSPRIVDHLNALADDLSMSNPSLSRRKDAALPHDETLGIILLGAAQRAGLAQMIERRSRSARVRLRGGKELRLSATGHLVLEGHDQSAQSAAVALPRAARAKDGSEA